MRYRGLAESFIIAEAVTGIDAHVLVQISRSDLLDSALPAPQAGFIRHVLRRSAGDLTWQPPMLRLGALAEEDCGCQRTRSKQCGGMVTPK